MPFHGPSQVLLNRTFDVSGIPVSNMGNAQDAATIVAEVLAAAVAQASKEFRHMWEPKITKLQGGYSADAELIFWSWQVDVLAYIQDCELDNKAAIQLIKEQTLDNARCEVEFQLDLCGSEILYQDLLRHLSMAFQGGDDEANLLVEFYGHRKQKSLRRLLPMSYKFLLVNLSSKSQTSMSTSTRRSNKGMQVSFLTTIVCQLLRLS